MVYHYTTIFKGYEKYYTVFYINERDNTKQMLPFFKDGLSDFYNTDRSWLKYTLEVVKEKKIGIFSKNQFNDIFTSGLEKTMLILKMQNFWLHINLWIPLRVLKKII